MQTFSFRQKLLSFLSDSLGKNFISTGGSLGAASLNWLLHPVLKNMNGIQVIHLCGKVKVKV